MNDTLRRVLTTLVIIACIGGLVLAAQHTRRADENEPALTGVGGTGTGTATGSNSDSDSGQVATPIVELQAPTPDSAVLSQAQLLIDLSTRYSASFVVNGVTVPDDELQIRSELNQVIFNPGPGKVIERFPAGRNCVQADIYRIDGVEEDVLPVRWCFQVT